MKNPKHAFVQAVQAELKGFIQHKIEVFGERYFKETTQHEQLFDFHKHLTRPQAGPEGAKK